MPDRSLPRWTPLAKRTDTTSKVRWQYQNDLRPKSERANPQHYDMAAKDEFGFWRKCDVCGRELLGEDGLAAHVAKEHA